MLRRLSGRGGTTIIDDLTEALLVEILIRLPAKVANQCKSVSKRWCKLVSDPWFIRSFVRHQIISSFPLSLPFTLIPEEPSRRYKVEFKATYSSNLLLDPDAGFSLDFLPPYDYQHLSYDDICMNDEEEELEVLQPMAMEDEDDEEPNNSASSSFQVLGASNDLVLCGRRYGPPYVYYVCNPFTKDWIELPATPQHVEEFRVLSGFVCDPCYDLDDNKTNLAAMDDIIISTSPPRYRVFSVPYYLSEEEEPRFPVHLFYSETGQWRELKLFFPPPVNFKSNHAIASNGKLHWLSGSDKIFAFDPFDNNHPHAANVNVNVVVDEQCCSEINLPAELKGFENIYLGVCRGRLRLLNLVTVRWEGGCCVEDIPLPIIKVWELEDYGQRKWRKVHDDVTLEVRETEHTFLWYSHSLCLNITFHPYDGDIVYLWLFKNFITLNLRTGMLQAITKDSPNELFSSASRVFSLVQPWFPTPVLSPQLP